MRAIFSGSLLLMLAACSGEPEGVTGPQKSGGNSASAATPETAPSASNTAREAERTKIERKDAVLEFSYEWPAVAAAAEPLDAWLRAQAETHFHDAHGSAEEGRAMAEQGGYPFHGYEYRQSWSALADTADVLVMQGAGYSYTGGAHGLPFTVSVIWDRAAGRRLATGDVIDISRLAGVARGAFCRELDRQREQKRGAPVDRASIGGIAEFNRCVDMKQQEILPISRRGKALDAIRVVIGPYEAGPYAEGSYEIDLPLTPAMAEAVMPAYRGWFATGTP